MRFYQQILQIQIHIQKLTNLLLAMSENNQVRGPKVFSIQVSGIRCTNCAAKIKKALSERLPEPNVKIAVNIMQEKISLTVFKEQTIYQALEILKDIGFPPVGEAVPISGGEDNQRTIAFLVKDSEQFKQLEGTLPSVLGVVKCSFVDRQDWKRINVTYNCEIVSGREVADIIEKTDPDYKVVNDRIDSFSQHEKETSKRIHIKTTIALCIYFLFVVMILPIIPGIDMFMMDILAYPQEWGIYSLSVILNTVITIYVLIAYARGFIVRAFHNYVQFHSTNMETLIALGSISAFSLYLFFLARYTIEYVNEQFPMRHMIDDAIMDINDALTSASIIVLVVTVGKYFEEKVKQKIAKMTDEIFPESTLFENMKMNFVEIKNRQLKIDREKVYDVSLIEKGDIIKIVPGVVLVDAILISGAVRAMQSARTGCEDIVQIKKGERLESGAVVHESKECLVIVENVLEKSLLIEIGTQIKLAQNQQDNEESGIQAVCKSISNVFVKGVILFSLCTVLVWSLLLFFEQVELEDQLCKVCYVVERGIGILVASCPCALGLAVPSVVAIILNMATKSGILIKNNGVFEKMKIAKRIAFDKTGTLFTRISKIEDHTVLSKAYTEQRMWEMVALIEKQIRHPLAEILYKQAFSRSEVIGTNYAFILLEKPKTQKEGISVKILDKVANKQLDVFIGNKNILINNKIAVPEFVRNSDASTELYLTANAEVLLVISLNTHSNLRPEAQDVVSKLKKEGLQVHILSGDSAESVEKIGNFLGIAEECQHPEQSAFMKMKWIKDNQEEKKKLVIMIGDGLNDIPCLQEAGIGISINAKSQLNINAADVVILSENLYKILALVRFLKKGNLFIMLNLFWAFAYNIIIMPVVAGAFYSFDIEVSPVWSSIAMSGSSLFVVGFSHLLSLFHYDDSLQSGKVPANETLNTTEEVNSSSRDIKKYAKFEDEIMNNERIA